MAHDASLGLDELMIVNPTSPHGEKVVLLGDDGALCRVDAVDARRGRHGLEEFFLGADGTLYRLERAHGTIAGSPATGSLAGEGSARGAGATRYFLGADGSLYELDRHRPRSIHDPACACVKATRSRQLPVWAGCRGAGARGATSP